MNRVLQNASDPSPTLVERLAKDQVLAYGAFFAVIFGAFQGGHALMQGMAHPTLPVSAILGLICLVNLEELDAQMNGDWPVVRGTLVMIVMTFITMVVAAASFYLDGGHHPKGARSTVVQGGENSAAGCRPGLSFGRDLSYRDVPLRYQET